MSIWKRRLRKGSAASGDDDDPERMRVPENTLGVTDSQILSAATVPRQPPPPPAPSRQRAADELPRDSDEVLRNRPWKLLIALAALGGLTGGVLLWKSGKGTTSPAVAPAPAATAPAATATAPSLPPVTSPSGAEAAPAPAAKKPNATTSSAKRDKHHHLLASKSSKRSHTRTTHRSEVSR